MKLSPEYKDALQRVTMNLADEQLASFRSISTRVFEQDAFHLYPGIIPHQVITSENYWKWTKCGGGKVVTVEGLRIRMFKLVPSAGARNATVKCPDYKLWMCHIYPSNTSSMTALWCVRGQAGFNLDINDYKFLAPFMSPVHAREIWGNSL